MHKLMSGAGLVLLGLAACNPAPAPEGGGSGDSANVAAAAPARAAAPAPAVVLEGAGLRIAGATPPRTLAFGIPAAEAIAALTEAFGRPPSERGENEECGGGAMAFAAWDGKVTIWLLDGRFAGWDDKGGLRTLEGVAVGSSRSDVESLPGFEAEESTLGTEFRAGGLSGILASAAADARVTHLWGGETCVFR